MVPQLDDNAQNILRRGVEVETNQGHTSVDTNHGNLARIPRAGPPRKK